MITIDKGIPLSPHARRGRCATYPFDQMEVGDSFCVSAKLRSRVSSAAAWWKGMHPGWDYTTRKVGDSFRVWRTA